MGYLLPTVLALLGISLQLVLPGLFRTYKMFRGPSPETYAPYTSFLRDVTTNGSCTRHHPQLLTGCEDMSYHDGIMYAACLGSLDMRRRWNPGLGIRALQVEREKGGKELVRDRIVRWDVTTDEAVEMKLVNFPPDIDLALHGFDVSVLSPTNHTFYAINHRASPPYSVIEKFTHDPTISPPALTYIKTIPIPSRSFGGAPSANDVFSVPELDGVSAMLVTNDFSFRESGLLRSLELVLANVWSFGGYVSWYDDQGGWKVVARGIGGSNGITGTKNWAGSVPFKKKTKKHRKPAEEVPGQEDNDSDHYDDEEEQEGEKHNVVKPQSNTIYVSGCNEGVIYAFNRPMYLSPPSRATKIILPLQKIPLPESYPDNPTLSHPSGNTIIIAAHPEPWKVGPGVLDPSRPVAPAAVYRFDTAEVGGGFYGGDGQHNKGEVRVERVFLDKEGRVGNLSSTAVYVEDDGEGKGDLYLTGLMMEGIMRCRGVF